MSHYLQRSRHDTTYLFRRRVPADLVRALGHTQLYKSLGTTSRREAVRLARALAVKTDQLFATAREMTKAKPDEGLIVDWTMSIDFDEFCRPRLNVQAEPHEQEAVNSAIRTALTSLPVPAPTLTHPATPQTAPKPSTRLADAAAQYLTQHELKPTTLKRYKPVIRRFVEHFGDDHPLEQITQSKFAEFAAAITADESREIKTHQTDITIAGTFMNWHASRSEHVAKLTAATLKPKRQTPASEDRSEHSLDDMAAIFMAAAASRQNAPEEFWVTVGCALTGCRVEELAQIDTATDLKRHSSGIWYLDLNGRPDPDGVTRRSMKRMTSWRVVPLHPVLVELGFVKFLQVRAQSPTRRPFDARFTPHAEIVSPDEAKNGNSLIKWSHYISRWGGKRMTELRKRGAITTPDTTYFHSMRHTLTTCLARAGISEEIRATIEGQSHGGVNGQVYTKLKTDPTATYDALVMGAEPIAVLLRRHLC
ncbi:hypothetical protein P3W85_04165 [Cupriavidus basilensis]|uniref:Core-binding (CB) domain-containing protein n=1 Tax=Cupriavidus basilensis TaxID=68895 RepID=A0ABT6AI69_9BURK|nr:DUF6538 domain-containing protein [Cupriavidus basilensis]MDF3832149.1 hypothetical protein [Cupriavidus basilensis]